jgi:hypothetical protein
MRRVIISAVCFLLLGIYRLAAYDLKSLAKEYGVTILYAGFTDTWNLVSYNKLEDEKRQKAAELLYTALKEYPKDIFKTINLKNLVLVRDLSFQGTLRASVPDNYKNALFMSFNDSYSDYYIVHCFIHELNHYIEFWLWGDYRYRWPEYSRLYSGNAKGGETAYGADEDFYSYRDELPGFLNLYSQLGQEEDRSEIIAYYFTRMNGEHENLIRKCGKDETFRRKAEMILKLYEDKLGFRGLIHSLKAEIGEPRS